MIEEKINLIIDDYLKKEYFSGVAINITHKNKPIYKEAKGFAKTTPEKEPMLTTTLFDIASITKIVISTVILRLVSEGKLKLEDKVMNYIEEIQNDKNLNTFFKEITVYQLLTHSSGLLAWHPFYCSNLPFYQQLSHLIPSFHKNKDVCYSDLNFMLLGMLIQKITRLTLQEAVQSYIMLPLNLKRLTYGPIDDRNVASTEYGNKIEMGMCQQRELTFQNWRDIDKEMTGEVNDGNTFYYFRQQSGHAGLFTSLTDLTKIGQLYAQLGKWEDKQLINSGLVEQSMKEVVPTRGIGWEKSSLFPEGVGHTGFTGTSLYIHPEKDCVVTILTNRLNVKKPVNINPFRREIHESVFKFIKEGGGK